MQPWYFNALTGGKIYPAADSDNNRHFVTVEPFPGMLALCGREIGEGWENTDVERTCEVCSEVACTIKYELPRDTPHESETIRLAELERDLMQVIASKDYSPTDRMQAAWAEYQATVAGRMPVSAVPQLPLASKRRGIVSRWFSRRRARTANLLPGEGE